MYTCNFFFFLVFSRRIISCQRTDRFAEHIRRRHKELIDSKTPEDQLAVIKSLKFTAPKEYTLSKNASYADRICSRKDVTESKPCPNCGVYYSSVNLFRHAKRCKRPDQSMRKLKSSAREKEIRDIYEGLGSSRAAVIASIMNDEMRSIVLEDNITKQYALYLCNKFKLKLYLDNYIRARIMLLAKFVKAIRSINKSCKHLEDVFSPEDSNCLQEVFNDTMVAIEMVGGFSEKDGCKAPNTINLLSTTLRQTAQR